MPAVFRDPHDDGSSTNSSYFIPTGKGTIGGKESGWKMQEITDGTSNTVMLVDAKRDIPWTKPEDIEVEVDPAKPLPHFGGNLTTPNFLAAFADGHVQVISNFADPYTMRAIFTIDGHEPVDPVKLNQLPAVEELK